MLLADLMKKGFLTSATATPATPATHRGKAGATVAVANCRNQKSTVPTVARVAGVAVANRQNLKSESIAKSMAPFQFELMEQDLAAGNTADELRRVNNITWRLMTAKGFTFDEAIKAAAEWVIDNEQRQDEAAFADVLELYSGLHQPITKESTQ
jgi:hypothetical protein